MIQLKYQILAEIELGSQGAPYLLRYLNAGVLTLSAFSTLPKILFNAL